MKQAIYYTSLIVALLLLGLGGCSPDVNLDESTLTVSQTKVELPGRVVSPTVVDVKATAKWAAAREASWIVLTQESPTKLLIWAEPNRTGRARTTQVVLSSGREVETIDVYQSALTDSEGGESGSISLGQSELEVRVEGDEIVVPVTTESTDWDIILTEDWVKATANPKKSTIALSISINASREERTATLIVEDRISGDNATLLITQAGVMYYILPYLEYGTDLDAIEAFELKRQSRVLERPKLNDPYALNKNTIKFRTRSPLFHRAEYKVDAKGELIEAKLFGAYDTKVEEENYIRYLMDHGFVMYDAFSYLDPNSRALAKVGIDGGEWYVNFTKQPAQPGPQPTFDTLPLGIVAEADWYKYGPDRIKAWEEARGGQSANPDGVINPWSDVLQIDWTAGTNYQLPFARTTYMLSKDTAAVPRIIQLEHAYPASPEMVKKFFWTHNGKLYLSDEFRELLNKSGFISMGYQAYNDKSIIILNAARKIQGAVRLNKAGTSSEYVSTLFIYVEDL